MHKGRLEAFTDGMFAVIITIMVLEMKAPDGPDFSALAPLFPVFVTYVLSYIYIGIYWNNHHHLLHVSERIDGRVMWANLFLLFWLSLFPLAIRWMDETGLAALPTAAYGFVLVMAALSYTALVRTLIACMHVMSCVPAGARPTRVPRRATPRRKSKQRITRDSAL